MPTMELDMIKHDWQRDLGSDVETMVREELATGQVPWISYCDGNSDGPLVREYPDGSRKFVTYVGNKVVLTKAPPRER